MAESPDALLEQAARAIYAKYPDRQPWDGDSYAFGENPGGYRTELARGQARAVLEAVAPAIAANALRDAGREWAEGAWQDAYAAFPVEDDISSVQAAEKWLNERADQITKEES